MKTTSFSARLADLNISSASHEQLDPVLLNREIRKSEDLHVSLGYALIQTPAFQNGSLNLYCGVPVSRLLPQNAPPLNEYLDFVVCRGQDAVLAVKLGETDEFSRDQLLHVFQAVPASHKLPIIFQPPNQTYSYDIHDIEAIITQQVLQKSSFSTSLCLIPSKLLKRLSAPSVCALAARPVSGTGRKFWFPTEYGRSLGILQGFRTDKNNRIHAFLGCPRECLDGLWEAASWGEPGIPAFPQEPISLTQRLDLASRGITTHPENVMDLIRQLGNTPLTEYFRNDPENLRLFQRTFPSADTYQQAAACLADCTFQKNYLIKALVKALAGPLIAREDIPLADKTARSVLFAASLLAKSKYLTWVGEMILHDYDQSHIGGGWTYKKWLQWAVYEIEKCQKDPDEDLTDMYDVLYHLAVLPFSIIYHKLNSHCA